MKKSLILILLIICVPFSYSIEIEEVGEPEKLRDVSEGLTRYVYGAGLVASVKDSEVSYYHSDRMLSNRLVTDFEGSVKKEFKSLPFGQKISNSGVRYAFATGKELDSSGLHYFGARYYDSDLGRFTSVDPVKDNHPYSYVRNNPLYFVDPYGRNGQLPNILSNIISDNNRIRDDKYLAYSDPFVRVIYNGNLDNGYFSIYRNPIQEGVAYPNLIGNVGVGDFLGGNYVNVEKNIPEESVGQSDLLQYFVDEKGFSTMDLSHNEISLAIEIHSVSSGNDPLSSGMTPGLIAPQAGFVFSESGESVGTRGLGPCIAIGIFSLNTAERGVYHFDPAQGMGDVVPFLSHFSEESFLVAYLAGGWPSDSERALYYIKEVLESNNVPVLHENTLGPGFQSRSLGIGKNNEPFKF